MAGSTTYQYVLSLQDKMTGVLHRAGITGSQTYDKLQAKQERLNASAQSFTRIIGRVGGVLAASFGMRQIYDSTIQMQNLDNAIRYMSKDVQEGQRNLDFLRDTSNRLGLSFLASMEGYKTLQGGLAGKMSQAGIREIFEGVSVGASVMKLTEEQAKGAFLALGQIASKGTVQAEELRGQLGERIPGAFGIAARAMKMTEQQLNKMMAAGKITASDFLPKFAEQMRMEYSGGLEEATKSLTASQMRMKNSLFAATAGIGEKLTPIITRVFNAISLGADKIFNNLDKIGDYILPIADTIWNILTVLWKVAGVAFNIVGSIIKGLVTVYNWLNKHKTVFDILLITLGSMTVGYMALRAAGIANNIVMAITSRLALEQALAGKTLTIWQGLAALATKGWSAAMVKLNLVFLASPIFWIITGIVALIAAISYVIYKTDGWGKMWQHTVNGAKMLWQTFTDYVRAYFGEMVNGIVIAVDNVIAAFYRAKNAVGLGDEKKNNEQIARYEADASKRKGDITSAWKKVKDDAFGAATEFKLAGQSLTWNSDKKIGDLVDKIGGKLGIGGKNKPVVESATSVPGGVKSPLSEDIKATSDSITKGGSRPTTINITLGNLVEQLSINTNTVQEGVQDMEVKVREALLRVLNSANGVAYGN